MKNKRLIWTLVFLAILTLGSIGTDLFKKEHQDANKVVKVGILQFVTHDALDQIEKGIEDAHLTVSMHSTVWDYDLQ